MDQAKQTIANTMQNPGVLVAALILFLFATETSFIVPFLLLSCYGLALLYKFFRVRAFPTVLIKQTITLFVLLWFPMLVANLDVSGTYPSQTKTLLYFFYFPAAVAIIFSLNRTALLSLLHALIFIVLSLWALDGLIQFLVGYNLFGYPYTPPHQLSGMFYPKIRMPYLLAVLAPLYFEFIRIHYPKHKWLLGLLLPFFLMLLLGGKRSAWIMFLFSGGGYMIYLYLINKRVSLKYLLVYGSIVCVFLIVFSLFHAQTKQRIESTLQLFSLDTEQIDFATAHRLDLWRVAIAITEDNWLNGIGTRQFRHRFNEYAEADNFWIRKGYYNGTTHPHLHILEIAAETGLIGLIGFGLFYFFLIRILFSEIRAGRLQNMPWLLCPLTAYLPLNAHLAFYGSYWFSVSIWSLAIALAVVSIGRDEQHTDH